MDPHDRGASTDGVASGLVHVELQSDHLVLEIDCAAVGHIARHGDRVEDGVAVPHRRRAGRNEVRKVASGGDDHQHSDEGQQSAITHDAMLMS